MGGEDKRRWRGGGLKEQGEQRKVWENEFDEINACDKPVNLRSTI